MNSGTSGLRGVGELESVLVSGHRSGSLRGLTSMLPRSIWCCSAVSDGVRADDDDEDEEEEVVVVVDDEIEESSSSVD